MSWTTGEIDIMINKAHLALAEVGSLIMDEEEVGHYPLDLYLKGRYLSSAIEAIGSDNDFTDNEIEQIMSCLQKQGVNDFDFTELDIVVNSYQDALSQGPAGSDGSDGATGGQGIQGIQGVQGDPGDNGEGYGGASVSAYILGAAGAHVMTLTPNTGAGGDGLAYQAGDHIMLIDNSRANTFITVDVITYNAATGQLDFDSGSYEVCFLNGAEVDPIIASGSSSNWSISLTGIRGVIGADGAVGVAGTRGSIWTSGAGAPSVGGSEITGDIYLNTSNGDLYRYSAGWGIIDNITGPTGATGSAGTPGAPASFYTQQVDHDTLGAPYTFVTPKEILGLGLNPFRINWAGPSSSVHIIVNATFKSKNVPSIATIHVEVNGTTVHGTELSSVSIIEDTVANVAGVWSCHIVTDVGNGENIDVYGLSAGSDYEMIQGTMIAIKDN